MLYESWLQSATADLSAAPTLLLHQGRGFARFACESIRQLGNQEEGFARRQIDSAADRLFQLEARVGHGAAVTSRSCGATDNLAETTRTGRRTRRFDRLGWNDAVTAEQERWAEAIFVDRVHGEAARGYVTERVTALAEAGDQAGVQRWLEIGRRVDALQAPNSLPD